MPGLPPKTISGVTWCLGHEPTPEAYMAHLVAIGRELRRVLREDGTFWLNLGDSYAGNAAGGFRPGAGRADGIPDERGQRNRNGMPKIANLKSKDLIGIPWRAAFALQADGWYLRQDVIWAKGVSFCNDYNGSVMPESVTDRCTKAHEYVFQFAKNERYYFDMEAVKEPGASDHPSGNGFKRDARLSYQDSDGTARGQEKQWGPGKGRQPRSVWAIMPKPYRGAHYAVWPEALVEPMILASSPLHGIVLDPFCGSGTTGRVAVHHNSPFYIGLDLQPARKHGELARRRRAMDNRQRVV